MGAPARTTLGAHRLTGRFDLQGLGTAFKRLYALVRDQNEPGFLAPQYTPELAGAPSTDQVPCDPERPGRLCLCDLWP